MLDSKPTDGQSAAQNQATQPQQNKPPTQGTHDQQTIQAPQFPDMEDEIPF